MDLGFTGTQRGMTEPQKISVARIMRDHLVFSPGFSFHHGDCIGADADSHAIALSLQIPIIGHPPILPDKRAFCQGFAELRQEKDYLIRNKDIVSESGMLIGTPGEFNNVLRSGTWSTIRHAIKKNLTVKIVYPDGTISQYY